MGKKPTVKELAKSSGVSERTLYMAMRVRRLGRDDLAQAVSRGEMSIHKAWRLAEGREPPTAFDKLIAAWNRCTDQDRVRFLLAVDAMGEDAEPPSANVQPAP